MATLEHYEVGHARIPNFVIPAKAEIQCLLANVWKLSPNSLILSK
jgi:hypothetical protein